MRRFVLCAAGLSLLLVCSSGLQAHNIQICKASDSSGPVNGNFDFTIVGIEGTFSVPVGGCTFIASVGTGSHTVIEQSTNDTVVTGITADPAADLLSFDLNARSATINVNDGETTTVTFTNKAVLVGRFTGGGSVFTSSGVRVTHGFELYCSLSQGPDNLEVNWAGNRFHLATLTSVSCSFNPATNVATITGTGTGRLNNVPGATITFTMTDAGEPGRQDFASFLITNANGTTVLTVSGLLTYGNQQFHPQTR